jgi:hypothetical protein
VSLAHLRAPKVGRTRQVAGRTAAERAAALKAYCGASREPVYTSVEDAHESGLELCDSCLVQSRKQRP